MRKDYRAFMFVTFELVFGAEVGHEEEIAKRITNGVLQHSFGRAENAVIVVQNVMEFVPQPKDQT